MTAENARLLRRLGAMLYDSLLVFAICILITFPFVMVPGELVEHGDELGIQLSGMRLAFFRLTLFLAVYLFFVAYWTRSGCTLGMQAWGLRVEAPDGRPPGLLAATIRFFVAILSWAAFGLGFLWQLWDPKRLTWHDRVSNTCLRYYPKPAKKKSN